MKCTVISLMPAQGACHHCLQLSQLIQRSFVFFLFDALTLAPVVLGARSCKHGQVFLSVCAVVWSGVGAGIQSTLQSTLQVLVHTCSLACLDDTLTSSLFVLLPSMLLALSGVERESLACFGVWLLL